ncbi:MAG TPA: Ig-like domain-containing protein, partial [Anaerolineae bacterium]|nr:Ig-like domain-containing protein [Anaerolineae bacterium]
MRLQKMMVLVVVCVVSLGLLVGGGMVLRGVVVAEGGGVREVVEGEGMFALTEPDVYTVAEDGVLVTTAVTGVLSNDTSAVVVALANEPTNGAIDFNIDGSFIYTPQQNFNGIDMFTYYGGERLPFIAAYFPFSEGSGNVTNDATAHNLGASFVGDPVFTTTTPNLPVFANSYSLYFDGDDRVTMPDNENINLGFFPQRTVMVWFKPELGPNSLQQIIWEEGGLPSGLNLYLYSGKLYAGGWAPSLNWPGTWLLTPNSLMAGQWYHVAVVIDSEVTNGTEPNGMHLYLDGQLITSGDGARLPIHYRNTGIGDVDNETRFHFGPYSGSGGRGFVGHIDEVQVYNGALSQADIQYFMESSLPDLWEFGEVTVNVLSRPEPVTANEDSYEAIKNISLSIEAPGLLSNDINTEGDGVAMVATAPNYGDVDVHLDGGFVYTPALGFLGSDSFTYIISNSVYTDVADVTIDVVLGSEPVTATADNYVMVRDTSLMIDSPGLLANDIDPDGDGVAMVVTTPNYGDVDVHLDGGFVYTPVNGFMGSDSFTYMISNTDFADTGVVTILVHDQCYTRLDSNGMVYQTVDNGALQQAIDEAVVDDLIKVAGDCYGTKSRAGHSQTAYISQTVTIQGGYTYTNWVDWQPALYTTTLDARDGGRVIYIPAGVTVTLSTLIIQNATTRGHGGGIYTNGYTVVEDSIIRDNDSTDNGRKGGGIYSAFSPLIIDNSQIYNNRAGDASGIYSALNETVIENSRIHDNQQYRFRDGVGGIAVRNSSFIMHNSEVFNNRNRRCGGILARGVVMTMTNSSIRNNTATFTTGGLCVQLSVGVISETQFLENISNVVADGGGINIMSSDLILTNSDIISNVTDTSGGGISVIGSSNVVVESTFIGMNSAGYGGGLSVGEQSFVVIRNSQIEDNVGTVQCGAIHNEDAEIKLNNVQIVGNRVTGGHHSGIVCNLAFVASQLVTMSIKNSEIRDNYALYGSGIIQSSNLFDLYQFEASDDWYHIELTDTIIADNIGLGGNASLGNFGSGVLTATRVIVKDNNDAGIFNYIGKMTLIDSAVVSNTAPQPFGGGIYNGDRLYIINSTIGHNSDGGSSGGIWNSGIVTMSHVTVAHNDFGGLYNYPKSLREEDVVGLRLTQLPSTDRGQITTERDVVDEPQFVMPWSQAEGLIMGMVTMENSIIAENGGSNCGGTAPVSGDYNVDSDGSCGLGGGNDVSNQNAWLGSLAENGGVYPSWTYGLFSNSPAFNLIPAGSNGCGTTYGTDQRGLPRPIFAACDSGAHEQEAAVASLRISEVLADHEGGNDDRNEYFELVGQAGQSLAGVTYIVIGDDSGGSSGVIEAVVPLTGLTMPADGYFLAAQSSLALPADIDLMTALNFEDGDNVTHMLVRDFSGSNGDDLDVNDDGVLDSMPWSEVIDSVALIIETNPPVNTEYYYGDNVVGPAILPPLGQAYYCPFYGWYQGSTSSVDDTPGRANLCYTLAPEAPDLMIGVGGVAQAELSWTLAEVNCRYELERSTWPADGFNRIMLFYDDTDSFVDG